MNNLFNLEKMIFSADVMSLSGKRYFPVIFIICFSNSAYAIGDGPTSFTGTEFITFLTVLISIVLVCIGATIWLVRALYKKDMLLKFFLAMAGILIVLSTYLTVKFHFLDDYYEMKYYNERFCNTEIQIKPSRNFHKFINIYRQPNILIKLTDIHQKTLPCVLNETELDNYYEIKSMIDIMIKNDLTSAVKDLYRYITFGEEAYYRTHVLYYYLTRDDCFVKHRQQELDSPLSMICSESPLDIEFAAQNIERVKQCITANLGCIDIEYNQKK